MAKGSGCDKDVYKYQYYDDIRRCGTAVVGVKRPLRASALCLGSLTITSAKTTSMKVTIQLDRSLGGHDQPFTNTDSVCGFVNLNLPHEDAVTRITVELSGMIGSLLLTFTLALELSLSLCL